MKKTIEERVTDLELNLSVALEARRSAAEANKKLETIHEAVQHFDRLMGNDFKNLNEEVKFLRWVITKFTVNGGEQLKSLRQDWDKKEVLARDRS